MLPTRTSRRHDPRQFDERPVLPNQKYGFALQTTIERHEQTACVRWNTAAVAEHVRGTGVALRHAQDQVDRRRRLRQRTICEYTFVVKDCKKPTVVCINGLSVNIMPTKMITLWDLTSCNTRKTTARRATSW
jgi:hypothetical protein